MGIDFKTETIIDVAREAHKYVGPSRNGRPAHYSFFLRAILKKDLEAVKVGRRWVTSVEAIQRWAEKQTADAARQPAQRSVAAQRRSDERAARDLERMGF